MVDLVVVGGPTRAFYLSRASTRADAFAKGATQGERDIGLREWLTHLGGRPHSELMAAFDTRVDRVRRGADVESFYVSDTAGPLLPGESERATDWGRQLACDMSARAHDQPVA
ncbi:MAG: hypothetical protein QOF53_2890 [Nocardioidaceae bacterium]|nr:hypothetical protein [Nocardioidaceae bacterium]